MGSTVRWAVVRAVTVVLVGALAVGACGGDGDGDGKGGGTISTVVPDLRVVGEDIDFDRDAYSAEPGKVTIAYVNEGNLPHTLVIEDVDGFKLDTGGGEEDAGTVTLDPGSYVLYCDVPGHRAAGMEATLRV